MVRGHISILFLKLATYNCSSTFMTPSAESYGNETSAAYYSVTFFIRDIEHKFFRVLI